MQRTLPLIIAALVIATNVSAADFDIRQPEAFRALVSTNSRVQKLAGGLHFIEGPVWLPRDGGCLIFSDIPANELKKWTAADGVSTYRTNTHAANGNCIDLTGRLLSCEGAARQVTITENDGSIQMLVGRYEGGRFNAPNDIVVKSDGSIWFTDPDYGLGNQPKEVPGMYVYRLEHPNGKTKPVVLDCDHPNGLCFSPDEKILYVADSGKPHQIRAYDVPPDGPLKNSRVFCVVDKGVPDGIRCDAEGNVWSSAGDGVQIFDKSGAMIGRILVPESPANLCFGGADGSKLFITARTSLYCIDVLARPAR